MSIIINMEMPNKKNGAVLVIYPDGKCAFEDGKTYQAIPAADVVPVRHGRWIKYCPHNSDMLTCSECEKYWILDGDQYDFRYCPNCGARMDGDA